MKIKINHFFFFLFLSLFLCPLNVFASGSATVGFDGSSSVIVGKEITVTLYISNLNGVPDGVSTVGGNLSFDSNYLQYVSGVGASSPFNFTINPNNNYKIAGIPNGNYITAKTTIFTFKFKSLKEGTTTIGFKSPLVGDGNGDSVTANVSNKTITIKEPPSTNNNLASLSTNVGNISFNKNTTSYNLSVDTNVSSITINASAEDSGAKISGIGTKNLNLGNNTLKVVVTAPSGDTKTYTINVNRKDNRSTNNNLSSLSISNGTINFNKNTTTYSVNVPFDVSSVKVTAKAEDSKSNVSVSGGNNLTPEQTTNVVVKVTAENGSVKTYTIKVTRGKDPNKPLSNNNHLSSLVPSTGELSPAFDKDSLNYEVNVPFQVKQIEFNATVEDTKYAKVDIEGPESLSVGNNKFVIKVTAEDNTTKEYNVIVNREKDPNAPASTNTFLSSIKISNGNTLEKFDKEHYIYYYQKKGKIKVEATAEDEDSKVVILENDGVYTIFVEAPSGDVSSYVLIPEKSSPLILYVALFAGGFTIGYFIRLMIRKLVKRKKVTKKEKTEK